MGLLDFILNLVGLLLWFNWRAAKFDPVAHSLPATLAGTLRRAEKPRMRHWHLPLGLMGLLLLRAPLYSQIGGALNWTGKVSVGVIVIPFRSNAAPEFGAGWVSMLLYSFYSFAVTLAVFQLWALLLSILKSRTPESDPLRQFLSLHLGRVERWPSGVKLVLPLAVVTVSWWVASWPLTATGILPPCHSIAQRWYQALLVGLGSYLAWQYLLFALLGLYVLHSHIYFGKQPFWQHLEITARLVLRPLRRLPLRWGKFDAAPWLVIALVWSGAHVAEHGLRTPAPLQPDGTFATPRLNLPGLVDWYERVSR